MGKSDTIRDGEIRFKMSSAIYFRIFGQTVALGLHGVNSLVMLMAMQNQELMRDPMIKQMTDMMSLYLTVWNVFFMLLYFSVALVCDAATVTKRDHLLPKSVRNYRHGLFSVVVFPTSFLIFELFWPFFLYDRGLLYPAFIDKIFSFESNLVLHGSVLPLALWELMFLSRTQPKSHAKNLKNLVLFFMAYNAFFFYYYASHGVFPYPILHMMYGTIYFPVFLASMLLALYLNYRLQWKLTALIWGEDKTKTKNY